MHYSKLTRKVFKLSFDIFPLELWSKTPGRFYILKFISKHARNCQKNVRSFRQILKMLIILINLCRFKLSICTRKAIFHWKLLVEALSTTNLDWFSFFAYNFAYRSIGAFLIKWYECWINDFPSCIKYGPKKSNEKKKNWWTQKTPDISHFLDSQIHPDGFLPNRW